MAWSIEPGECPQHGKVLMLRARAPHEFFAGAGVAVLFGAGPFLEALGVANFRGAWETHVFPLMIWLVIWGVFSWFWGRGPARCPACPPEK